MDYFAALLYHHRWLFSDDLLNFMRAFAKLAAVLSSSGVCRCRRRRRRRFGRKRTQIIDRHQTAVFATTSQHQQKNCLAAVNIGPKNFSAVQKVTFDAQHCFTLQCLKGATSRKSDIRKLKDSSPLSSLLQK